MDSPNLKKGRTLKLDSQKLKRINDANVITSFKSSSSSKIDSQNPYPDLHTLYIVERAEAKRLNYFSLQQFSTLKCLYLDLCPPSTAIDLFELRSHLELLDIRNAGITDLSQILCPIPEKSLNKFKPMILSKKSVSVDEKFCWRELRSLRLQNCGIARLDASLHFLPVVEHVDISNNDICHLVHFQDCMCLKSLNASYNRIGVLSNISRIFGNVHTLNLSFNRIRSLDGLDKLFSLRQLDVSYNCIDDFSEISYICGLPFLESLFLQVTNIAFNVAQFCLLCGIMWGSPSHLK